MDSNNYQSYHSTPVVHRCISKLSNNTDPDDFHKDDQPQKLLLWAKFSMRIRDISTPQPQEYF